MDRRLKPRQDGNIQSSSSPSGFFVTSTIINNYGYPQAVTASIGSEALTTVTSRDSNGFQTVVTTTLPAKYLTTSTSINALGYPVFYTSRISPTGSQTTATSGSGASSAVNFASATSSIGAGVGSAAQTGASQPSKSSHHSGISGGALAAAIVVPVIVVAVLLLLGFMLVRRRRRSRRTTTSTYPEKQPNPGMRLASDDHTRRDSPRASTGPGPMMETAAGAGVLGAGGAANSREMQDTRHDEPPRVLQPTYQPRAVTPVAATSPASKISASPPQINDDWRADDIGRLTDPFGDPASKSDSSAATSSSSTAAAYPPPAFHSSGHHPQLSDVPSSGLASNSHAQQIQRPDTADSAASIVSDGSYQDADVEVAEVAQARPTHLQRASVVQLANGNSPPREGGHLYE